jgi:hypothetical protein
MVSGLHGYVSRRRRTSTGAEGTIVVAEEVDQKPPTERGETAAAGEGVDDMDIAEQVHEQTSKDLRAEQVFERESEGASSDTAIDKADPDETPG